MIIASVFVALIATLHFYFLVLEMFQWTSKRTRRAFGTTLEFAEATKVMAANQGLYNGFLAAGLAWALVRGLGGAGFEFALFFLLCILVAGLYGAVTVTKRIFYIQTIPAAAGILALWLGI